MYAPLNTPVLHLSNETDVLLYAANGTDCLTATGVSSTATLYVNGDPLEATYVWEWNPKLCTCEHAVDEDGQQLQNTIIVTAVNSTSAPGVVTCKATVTLDGPFKGKVYSKDFTVTQTKIGTSIISQETYYALIHNKHSAAGSIKTPPTTGDLIVRDKDGNQLYTRSESQFEEWSLTPPKHTPDTNGWKYWTTVKTTYSTSLDDFEFSTPIINEDLSGVYSLAQGKTTNYYGNFEPTRNPEPSATQVYKPNLRVDDCWFDTSYKEISTAELATLDLASKYINYYVGEGSTKTLVTSSNYTTLSITPKTTKAYKKGALKQCIAIAANGNATWEDIGDEMVTNKLTATYINALDITAKKIKILNDEGNTTLFEADGLSNNHTVKIAGFDVSTNGLFTTEFGASYSDAGKTDSGVYVGKDGIKLGKNFSVDQSGNVLASSLKISSSQTIGEALGEDAAKAQTNLENALKDPATAGDTTLGSTWLSTTSVYAQNLHVANADITNQILVGPAENPILYANVNDSENVKIGGFIAGSTTLKGGTNGTVGMNSSSATGTYSFWAGNATPSNAPFYVTNAGAVKATNLTIQNMTASGTSGVTINGGKFTVKTKGTSPTTLFEVDSSASKTTLSGDIYNVGNIFSGCKKNSNNTISATTTTGGNIYSGGVIQSIGGIVNNKTLINTGLVYSNGGIINRGVLHSNGTITSNGEVYTTGNVYFYANVKESDGKVTVSGGYNPVIQLAPANSNCLYTTLVDIATYTAGSGLNQGASWKTVTLPTGLYGSGKSKVKGAYVTGYLSSKNNLTVTNVTEGNCGKTSTSVTEIMNMGTQGYTPYVSWDNNNLYVLLPPIKVDSNVSPGFTIKMCVLIVGAI